MTEGLEYACEHVGYTRYMVTAGPNLGAVEVRCPCCGLRGYQDARTLLGDGPPCPYCDRQPVPA